VYAGAARSKRLLERKEAKIYSHRKLAFWVASVVAFVAVRIVAEQWVPEYLAIGLAIAASLLLLQQVFDDPERQVPLQRRILGALFGSAIGMAAWVLFNALLPPVS
jgi:hypothetical protein